MIITLKYKSYEWEFKATSYENGLKLASERYTRMGLIGKAYIHSSCGKAIFINS